jgi:hypothetical protein
VAGERLRYSPSVRRLIGWPGRGADPVLVRLGMHPFCNTLEAERDVFSQGFCSEMHVDKGGKTCRRRIGENNRD